MIQVVVVVVISVIVDTSVVDTNGGSDADCADGKSKVAINEGTAGDDDSDELFCRMVDRQKSRSVISSQEHYQVLSSSQISDMLQAEFEIVPNWSPGFIE